jgi:hypothetical protein
MQMLGYYKMDFKETVWEGLDWTDMTQDRNKWPACNHVDKPSVSIKYGGIP